MFREFEISCVDALETTPHGKIFNMKKKKPNKQIPRRFFSQLLTQDIYGNRCFHFMPIFLSSH